MSITIFLDFDGVIRVPAGERKEFDFCQKRMLMLSHMAKAAGAKIVVSSDWRNMESFEEIKRYLSPHLNGLLHEDWKTPIVGHRHNEIQAWLDKYHQQTRYVVLDDFRKHFDGASEEMLNRLVLCTNRHGLQASQSAEIFKQLSK